MNEGGVGRGRPRILVVQHSKTAGLGALRPELEAVADLEILPAYSDPVAYKHAVADLVKSPQSWDAAVALGGRQSVYEPEKYEVIEHSLRLLREAVHRGVPILGVCLGAQLLAWSLGALVRPGHVVGLPKEIGWHPIKLTERGKVDPAFKDFREDMPVFHWHGDTFDLPQGAWLLATSELYPVQAFRWGQFTYGIQFHLEVEPEQVAGWVAEHPEDLVRLDPADADLMVIQAKHYGKYQAEAARVFSRHWAAGVVRHSSEASAK